MPFRPESQRHGNLPFAKAELDRWEQVEGSAKPYCFHGAEGVKDARNSSAKSECLSVRGPNAKELTFVVSIMRYLATWGG